MNKFFVFLVSTFFALLASIVLLYISISSGIGPWISPVIVLSTAALMRLFNQSTDNIDKYLAGMQAVGASVGLVAVAIAFTFPAYFFLEPAIFNSFIATFSVYSFGALTLFILVWSLVGVIVGHFFAQEILKDHELKVPVAELVKTTISASHEKKDFLKLLKGGSIGAVLCSLRAFFQSAYFLRVGAFGSLISSVIMPTIWAVGFLAGPAMALGLLLGICLKYAAFSPLYTLLSAQKMLNVSAEQYFVAISSGLVLVDLSWGILHFCIKKIKQSLSTPFEISDVTENALKKRSWLSVFFSNARFEYAAAVTLLSISGLWLYGITSRLLILFVLATTFVSVYQMTLIAGQIGLVQFGRFATFVMLPTLVFFKITPYQAVLVSAVVCIIGAVAASMLFQYRLADELKMKRRTMYYLHVVASILGALFIAGAFYLLCCHLDLGSKAFFGFRGYARALLIKSFDFDLWSLGVGLASGFILKLINISPAMVLGGLLMPKELVLAFLVGAGLSYIVQDTKKYMQIASGVFAAEAIWIFIGILASFI